MIIFNPRFSQIQNESKLFLLDSSPINHHNGGLGLFWDWLCCALLVGTFSLHLLMSLLG